MPNWSTIIWLFYDRNREKSKIKVITESFKIIHNKILLRLLNFVKLSSVAAVVTSSLSCFWCSKIKEIKTINIFSMQSNYHYILCIQTSQMLSLPHSYYLNSEYITRVQFLLYPFCSHYAQAHILTLLCTPCRAEKKLYFHLFLRTSEISHSDTRSYL